ncbi:MAG: cob(I)yrinic acid a,c-diamide adenosyltransferase [Candidatus Kerfeldbacteria bacterium]|nr:cob(I)yrinic acid a,c-diamide adenosyltransferase [Candidatus Kerfeldbacteria bacterium]
MKIYTKTGDQGESGLFGGKRVPKNHARLEAYGTVDELNAHIGFALSLAREEKLVAQSTINTQLKTIQHTLFTLGAHLATPYSLEKIPATLPTFSSSPVEQLETWIDDMERILPQLTGFILPGGSPLASAIHIARTVTRRVERAVITLHQEESVLPEILQYLNRLSDYLFVLSRYINFHTGHQDVLWKK